MTNFFDLPNPIIYIARSGFLDELCRELGDVSLVAGNLVFSQLQKPDVCFAADVWIHPQIISFESISKAIQILRNNGRFWFLNPVECIRRSSLILAQLRNLPPLQHSFPIKKPLPLIGCYSLLDKNTLVYSQNRWKNPPLGDFQFIEDKTNPPNRAYLKLWEAFSLLDDYPGPGDLVVDLGASPGGWTYVAQKLGARVIAVDKAPLHPRIAQLPQVTFLQQSAFALNPRHLSEPVDWLLCDVACYPERLYRLITGWLTSGKVKKMIITIKLQGKTDLEVIHQFRSIAGARVLQLLANKHEVTFFYPISSPLSFPSQH